MQGAAVKGLKLRAALTKREAGEVSVKEEKEEVGLLFFLPFELLSMIYFVIFFTIIVIIPHYHQVDGVLSLLERVEPEDCYKRTFCALATGE